MISLMEIEIGDVLSYWFDTGCFGNKLMYVRVIKKGKKKIKVIDEHEYVAWKYPHYFNRIVSEKFVQEMIDEGSLKL